MKRILMIAYHFPPMAGSSGIQRTLRFVQQLPAFDWQPIVLTVQPRAYQHTSEDLLGEVPSSIVVRRAFALDAARHLSIRGRYIHATALPDRWATWRFDGVRQGLRLIKEFQPQVIWSTYPIATAHLIGAELHRRSGLPWVADFRDPMAQADYPYDQRTWRQFEAIEKHVVHHAALSFFTTPSAATTYRQRYPQSSHRIKVLENGYDEGSFATAERAIGERSPLMAGAITLLHSGIVYPTERDPTKLMEALQTLKNARIIQKGEFNLRFRAAVHDDLLQSLAREHGVEAFIETCPAIPYKDALQEMLCTDALVVIQGEGCNNQIPAKAYEYLRAGRPILCLAGSTGDTAALLRKAGVHFYAGLDRPDEIAAELSRFLDAVRSGTARHPKPEIVRRASRRQRSKALALALDRLARNASARL